MNNTSQAFTKAQLQKIKKTVDDLALAKEQIAEATKKKAPFEKFLKELGEGVYVGTLHDATVYQRAGQTSVDWETIAKALGYKEDNAKHVALKKKHTSTGASSICITVTARKPQEN